MRRAVLAAATLLFLAGCGGADNVPLATVPVISPAALLEPTADPSPDATRVPSPMAVSPQVHVQPTQVPTAVPTSVPTLRPAPVVRSAPRPVITRTPQPVATTPPAPVHAEPAKVLSDNWSGYVARGTFWQVGGSWTEPTATCTAASAESVFWVGLGGYPSYPLYQAGSGAFCRNGAPVHVLWYELLNPGATQPLVALVQINPGDHVSAAIDLHSGTVHLADDSSGYSRDVSFTPQSDTLGSAEWIAEATSHGGTVSTLADFGSVDFAGCSANLGAAGLAAWPATQLIELTLTDHSGGRAAPDDVSATPGGGGFTVNYLGS